MSITVIIILVIIIVIISYTCTQFLHSILTLQFNNWVVDPGDSYVLLCAKSAVGAGDFGCTVLWGRHADVVYWHHGRIRPAETQRL